MELKNGYNSMSIFGSEFSNFAYCWLDKDGLWLSMIDVKQEHRKKGVLHRLLEDVKKANSKVLIPTPFLIVRKTAEKHGYVFKSVVVVSDDGDRDRLDVLIWEST